ncbi:acyl-CoA dehydrogenase family protein [Humibacter sp.]|uniref:acyl-CoA dehydrogenase family protein n=1 Tax=Humibacter sp. TaxID=1940291 RepID=UPI002CC2B600|nr:acyl-CoA dehydrogenase family protein [Humibacter sp.]HVX09166.1 acyl-CoA dehydrogenase family protein [Humibacter sp.]
MSELAKGVLASIGTVGAAEDAVRRWADANVPPTWREAAVKGGPAAVRTVRTPAEYRQWYPTFARSGLVVPQWPVPYGGLDWSRELARAADAVLAPLHLPRLNPLGLNNTAAALFAHGTEQQRLRYLPKIVDASETWCQLFSEPGAGSDLAALATRAERVEGGWTVTGQKVWTTWAHDADMGILLARTDPALPKRAGISYFLLDMHQAGVTVRPLVHIGGEVDFNEVFLDDAFVADDQLLGDLNGGWTVARATLAGERQMVAGAGSGGVDRIGGGSARRLVTLAQQRAAANLSGGWDDPHVRRRIVRLWCEEQIRGWTNDRVRAAVKAGGTPGAESSIGKVAGAELNQRIQEAAADLLGAAGTAWPGDAGVGDVSAWAASLPFEVKGMLRSRANTIEGGTTEVNKNILGERVLGLPKEPDAWEGRPWRDVPRS